MSSHAGRCSLCLRPAMRCHTYRHAYGRLFSWQRAVFALGPTCGRCVGLGFASGAIWAVNGLRALRTEMARHGLESFAIENFDPLHWCDILAAVRFDQQNPTEAPDREKWQRHSSALSYYGRNLHGSVAAIGLDRSAYGTNSMRRARTARSTARRATQERYETDGHGSISRHQGQRRAQDRRTDQALNTATAGRPAVAFAPRAVADKHPACARFRRYPISRPFRACVNL